MLLDTYSTSVLLLLSYFSQMKTLDLQKHMLFLFLRKNIRTANSVQESELFIKQKVGKVRKI